MTGRWQRKKNNHWRNLRGKGVPLTVSFTMPQRISREPFCPPAFKLIKLSARLCGPQGLSLRTFFSTSHACKLRPCTCTLPFTHICYRHACLQTQRMCLHHTIYAHLLQAPMPANSAHVPAPYYLRTFVAGIDSCKLSPCSCSPIFTYICCRHRCLQTQPMCLQPIIYVHLLQAPMPANSANVPAACYLRTPVASNDACKLSPRACSFLFTHIRRVGTL